MVMNHFAKINFRIFLWRYEQEAKFVTVANRGTSVVDRHHFDPIRSGSYSELYTCWKIRNFKIKNSVHSSTSLRCFIFLVGVIGVKIFKNLDSVAKIYEKV
jgi:hypothetical protein